MLLLDIQEPNNCHECDMLGISDLVDIKCPCREDSDRYSFDERPLGCPIRTLMEEPSNILNARVGKYLKRRYKMTVGACIQEIRKIKDAIDTLEKYSEGAIPNIAEQHVAEIEELLESYIDIITEMKVVGR